MKIVAVLGSPRPQGNSTLMAEAFLEAAREQGAAIETYALNHLHFKGCQGCGTCKTDSQRCVVEDDFAPIYEAIREADLLVLASPVYFGEISGQLKCFFDRTYAFLNPDFSSRLAPGKKSVMLLAQGAPSGDMFTDIHPRYERWLKMLGFRENHLVRAVGVMKAGEVKEKPEVLAEVRELARRLVS